MRGLAGGDELLEGGLCARNESLAGFGQADAARRTDEERCADPRLECAYRLTNSRRSHPELRGRSAEIAVLGNAQERLHAVECALPDCEVLLHSPSILPRIVARRKRRISEWQVGGVQAIASTDRSRSAGSASS